MCRREDGSRGKYQKLRKSLTSKDLWLGLLSPSFLVAFITIDKRGDLIALKNSELPELTDIATWSLWSLCYIVTLAMRVCIKKRDILTVVILRYFWN